MAYWKRPWTQAALRNLKTTALTLDHVRHRNANIIKPQLGLTTWRMQAVKYAQWAH
jgi:hypothetical protein